MLGTILVTIKAMEALKRGNGRAMARVKMVKMNYDQ